MKDSKPCNSEPDNNIPYKSGQVIITTFHSEYKIIVKRFLDSIYILIYD